MSVRKGNTVIKNIKETPIKAVIYYICQQEHADLALMDSIYKECAEFKKQEYQPVIFISGKESLEECLYYLMKHNIELMATHPERFKGSANWAKPNIEAEEQTLSF